MAGYADDKTEPPTPRRREQTREQGNVAKSQDLSAAGLLLASFIALALLGPGIWRSLLAITRTGLGMDSATRLDEVMPFAGAVAVESFRRLLPFLIILFVAILLSVFAQVGFLFTWKPLMPSLSKISPLSGFKRLFSIRSVMTAVASFGKLLVVGAVAYLTVMGSAPAIINTVTFGFPEIFGLSSSFVFRLGIRLAAALLILSLLDLAWQRYRHERDMRMTKEEVKDELRSMDGDPQIKRRRREVQIQLALQRLRQEVPKADVVVTNPTHVAVAISYEPKMMAAPKVVAKGADLLALRIRQLASEFGIPIVQRPPLARALYEAVDVGEQVPERLYQAIAEILAYVYELTGRSPLTGRRGRSAVRA